MFDYHIHECNIPHFSVNKDATKKLSQHSQWQHQATEEMALVWVDGNSDSIDGDIKEVSGGIAPSNRAWQTTT